MCIYIYIYMCIYIYIYEVSRAVAQALLEVLAESVPA